MQVNSKVIIQNELEIFRIHNIKIFSDSPLLASTILFHLNVIAPKDSEEAERDAIRRDRHKDREREKRLSKAGDKK